MDAKGLTLEIRPVLETGRESGARAIERRARWLKFADFALRNQGVAPTDQDVKELTDLGRAEQESIKKRIDSSVKNYRRTKSKSHVRTLRRAA
jgi:hypothetical protein